MPIRCEKRQVNVLNRRVLDPKSEEAALPADGLSPFRNRTIELADALGRRGLEYLPQSSAGKVNFQPAGYSGSSQTIAPIDAVGLSDKHLWEQPRNLPRPNLCPGWNGLLGAL